jgi:hypothetical protein
MIADVKLERSVTCLSFASRRGPPDSDLYPTSASH